MSLPLARLSSLDLIRGFVAVGRRMSITVAAQDLCLTQSAVSRQIAALEEQLGVKLLMRGHRSIAFTAEGGRFFGQANEAMQTLQDAMGEIHATRESRPVVLSATIGVTGLWLLPLLGRFQKLNPGIGLRVSADNRLADLRQDGIDLAIRFAARPQAPAEATFLFGQSIAPVAHPSLGLAALQTAQAVSTVSLLEFDDPRHSWLQWGDWFEAVGWPGAQARTMLRFNQYDQVIQAALDGQGIALGRLELMQPLLDSGRLVRLTAPTYQPKSTHGYWLLGAHVKAREDVQRVTQWIEREAMLVRAVAPEGATATA